MTDQTLNVPQSGEMVNSSNVDAQNNSDWISGLDNDVKTMVQTKGYKTPADLAKAYMNAEKMIGGDKIALPGKDAKPEDWDSVYNKLGRPSKPTDYQLDKPEWAGNYDDSFADTYKGIAHKVGLTGKQAKEMHDGILDYLKEVNTYTETIKKQEYEELDANLRRKWGASYDRNFEIAKRTVKEFGIDADAMGELEKAVGGPKMAELFYKIGSALTEDNLKGVSRDIGTTPESAKQEINKLYGDKEFMKKQHDKNHPEHQWAIDYMGKLHNIAFSN